MRRYILIRGASSSAWLHVHPVESSILCADARREGKKVGEIPIEWTVNGLLGYLGREIEETDGVRYPILSEDE